MRGGRGALSGVSLAAGAVCDVIEEVPPYPMIEEPLSGGFVNAAVVRVGDTVRRKAGAWTPTIHRLLRHVRERGVTWAPEPRGLDERGREVLAFIPGEVPHAMPEWVWREPVLVDVAVALRQWHEATADFDRSGAVWGFAAHEPAEVICHNDFAPYNCVFRAGRFAGAIDYDFCSPGPRLWDLAYAAYRFVPLMPPAGVDLEGEGAGERSPFGVAEQEVRLERLLDAYAIAGERPRRWARAELLRMAVRRLGAIADWTEGHAAGRGDHPLASHARMYRAHACWLGDRVA